MAAGESTNFTPTGLLKRVPFFKALDASSLRDLAAACQSIRVSKGEDVFVEGDEARGMFLVVSGGVKVYRAAPSGREQILAIEPPGAIVAELPLLDGEPYPASCAALEDSELLLLPIGAFEDLLRRRPDVAMGALRVIGRRLRQLVTLVDELSLLEVPQRLAKYLLDISDRRGESFTLPLSNQEIANRLGTVREIVSRNLHRLAQQGAIRIDGRRITIVDADQLQELIEEGR